MDQIVGMAQLYFMPHPLLEIVQRPMAHPVEPKQKPQEKILLNKKSFILQNLTTSRPATSHYKDSLER